jgi:hypothetical protein
VSTVAVVQNQWGAASKHHAYTASVTNTPRTSAGVEDGSSKQPLILDVLVASNGERCTLKVGLWVVVERDGDLAVVADNGILSLFGTGLSIDQALADYSDMVLEHFALLRERARQGRLGHNQVAQLRFLTTLLSS